MSNPAFQRFIEWLWPAEGGAQQDVDGVCSNFGVRQNILDKWRSARGLSHLDVNNLTRAEAADIYKFYYWDACGCDELPELYAITVADCAVNEGQGHALEFLRLARTSYGEDVGAGCVAYLDMRRTHYKEIADARPDLRSNLRGWLNRVDNFAKHFGLEEE